MIIKNALIYSPEHVFRRGWLNIDQKHITEIRYTDEPVPSDDDICLDAKGSYLIPGLIDIHLHGCMGADFSDGTREALDIIARYELSQGVTGFTPATMTIPIPELEQVCQTVASYTADAANSDPTNPGARFLGIHLEGPYFSEKKKGAQPAEHLRLPSADELMHLQELSGGHITQADVAPELPGALDFIRNVSQEITVSLGHTAATYDEANAGFEAGASHVTHMFNGMTPFAHRDPGIVGAAADHPNVRVEMICDGIHLHPSMIRSMFKLFGAERILMISDSIRATGMPEGDYTLGGQPVHYRNGVATLDDGTIAGSAVSLMECLRRVVSFGIPLESAIRCTSENQARELGLFHEVGSIATGKYANLVLLNEKLQIQKVILEGQITV